MGNDHHLLARLRDGDTYAWHLIYERYRDSLLAVSRSLYPDAHVAEDVVQDVFVSFYHNAPRLQLRGNLFHYLCTGIRNAIRDIIRRRARLRRLDPPPLRKSR